MASTPNAMPDEIVGKSSDSTEIQVVQSHYTWEIKPFSMYCKMGDKITSRSFETKEFSCELRWHLEINSNGWYLDDGNKMCMSLHLHLDSDVENDIPIHFKLSILNSNSEVVYKREHNKQFGQIRFHGNNSFIRKHKLLHQKAELFPGDKLTIRCDITVLKQLPNSSSTMDPMEPPPKNSISSDNSKLKHEPVTTELTSALRPLNQIPRNRPNFLAPEKTPCSLQNNLSATKLVDNTTPEDSISSDNSKLKHEPVTPKLTSTLSSINQIYTDQPNCTAPEKMPSTVQSNSSAIKPVDNIAPNSSNFTTTSIKHDKFLTSPSMNLKNVTDLPGIGKVYGSRLKDEGFNTADKVLKKFLELKKDQGDFEKWLKDICGANARWGARCSQFLSEWCNMNGC